MPRLPQYYAQAQPQGAVRGVIPGAVNVLPAVALAQQGADAYQHGLDRQAAIRKHEAEKIALEEAQSAVSLTMSQKRAEYTEKIITRQQSGEPLAGMTAQLLKEFDADAEKTIAATPELGRRALKMRMADLKAHLHERAFGMEADARRAQVVTDFSTGLDADSRVLFADHSQFGPVLAARLAAADALVLDPQTKAKVLDSTRESLAYAAGSGLVDKSPDAFLARTGNAGGKIGKDGKPLPSDPAKAAEAVKNDPMLANMRPEQLRALTERATTMVVNREAQLAAQREQAQRRAEAAAEKLAREQDRAAIIVFDRLRNGIPTEPGAPEMRVLAGSPYAKEYQTRAASLAQSASVAGLPIEQQRQQLDALRMDQQKGTNQALEHEIAQRESILRASESAYKADPLRAGAERGLIGPPAALDVSTFDTLAQGLPARVEQAKVVQTRTGSAVSPFLSTEADAVSRQLQALPWDERGKRVAQITSQMTPAQAQAFAKQVDAKDRPLALEMAAGASMTKEGQAVAQWVARGQQFLKDKPQDGEKSDAVRNQIATEVGAALSGQARQDVIDAAFYAYMGQKDDGRAPSAKGVVSLVLGGPLTEHNGRTIPVPQGIDLKDNLRKGLYTVSKPGPVFAGGATLTEAEFRALLPEAQLEPRGFGQYLVRSGGGFLTDAGRTPIVVRVVQ